MTGSGGTLGYTFMPRLYKDISRRRTTYQALKLEPFEITCGTTTPIALQKKEMNYLYQLRQAVKTEIYHTRVQVLTTDFKVLSLCPICRKPLFEHGEMHEALITKGDVQGLPFHKRIEINCPQNCVLLQNDCHFKAQHYERAKRIIARYLIRWNGAEAIKDFLHYMNEIGATKALEVERQLISWKLF